MGSLQTTTNQVHGTARMDDRDRTSLESLNHRPIVFFDGVCSMCNRLVDFVLKWDRHGMLRMASLQGETAAELLETADTQQLNTIVLLDADQTLRYSSAIVRLLWHLGGVWRLIGWMLWLIPRPLRNLGYWIIAKNRYRLFGKKDSCRIPTPEERQLLLP